MEYDYAGKAYCRLCGPEHPASTACRTAIHFGRATMDSSSSKGIPAPAGQRNPGDESEPGAPQTAEDICPECQGSGRQGQSACANCGGSGRIVKIIGDA
jgi:DnaJ-class molecular chaperone